MLDTSLMNCSAALSSSYRPACLSTGLACKMKRQHRVRLYSSNSLHCFSVIPVCLVTSMRSYVSPRPPVSDPLSAYHISLRYLQLHDQMGSLPSKRPPRHAREPRERWPTVGCAPPPLLVLPTPRKSDQGTLGEFLPFGLGVCVLCTAVRMEAEYIPAW